MKEIRTIRFVEVTDVKFVADDGKEFVGENAERDCKDYERTRDKKKVEAAFKRLDFIELKMPFVDWFSDEQGYYKINLNSKTDYIAMMDYFNIVWHVYDNSIEEPKEYPYNMTVWVSCDCVGEYKRDIKAELMEALNQFN